jgi:hypothetical protein
MNYTIAGENIRTSNVNTIVEVWETEKPKAKD